MIIKELIQTTDHLTTISENATLADALTVLEDTGYRCIPILDKSGTIFRGNIYKMHLYRHKSRGGDMTLPVTTLLKNATKFISINDDFFTIFFAIRDLPYIAVLDEQKHFYGILTHNHLINMLNSAWNVQTGSYVITIKANEERGFLVTVAKEITRYCQISNIITLNPATEKQLIVTLPEDVTPQLLAKITKRLRKKQIEILHVEDLSQVVSHALGKP